MFELEFWDFLKLYFQCILVVRNQWAMSDFFKYFVLIYYFCLLYIVSHYCVFFFYY